MYKFLYYLSAIGENMLNDKLSILKENLLYIHKNINMDFDIILNCYDDDITKIQNMIHSFHFLNKIMIHKKKGRLVELWESNPYHGMISKYDYILYIMDDVLINNLDMKEFIDIKKKHKISFLSPKIMGGTWEYMRNRDNVLGFSNRIEIFCLLFDKDDFIKFMDINDIENPHTWGVDLLLGYFNIKSAICYKFMATHMLPSNTDGGKACSEMNNYLMKHGFANAGQVYDSFTDVYLTIEI